MKVCHLTSVHPKDDIRIFWKECVSLREMGHEVCLVAPGTADEIREGVRILAVPKAETRRERWGKTTLQVARRAMEENADLYHFHDPELLPVGLYLKARGKNVFYDAHENLPASIRDKDWINPWIRIPVAILADGFERGSALVFDGIVTATPDIARRFRKADVTVVQNFPDLREWAVPGTVTSPGTEGPYAVYVGVLTEPRGAREMILAMGKLPKGHALRLKIAGRVYPESLRSELAKLPGAERVDWLGNLSREEIVPLVRGAALGLVLFHPADNHVTSQPLKLFEYMAAGIPVVASHFPHWRQWVEKERCGLIVDPRDVDAISRAIGKILAKPDEARAMGTRGEKLAHRRFGWASQFELLAEKYQALAARISKRPSCHLSSAK